MPVPLGDAEAAQTNGFPGIHAYNEYLTRFYAPHPSNSRENERIKNWIVDLCGELKVKAEANGIQVETVADDPTKITLPQNWFTKGEQWVVDSRNVIVKLHGSDPELKKQSILVNAHYDSVATSNGVTDNGMGVSVTLELLRYYVDHPPKHTLIFLFNNMEEGGLIGGHIFTKHPWFDSIKTFINLEGGGAGKIMRRGGREKRYYHSKLTPMSLFFLWCNTNITIGGRSLLTRSNTLDGVKKFAAGAHYLHASPLANDMLKSKLMKSDTDYSAFDQAGLPGLDIAFYTPRSHYHTQRDSIAYTTPFSVQYMGEMALATLRGLDDGGLLKEDMYEPSIYYDFLGRFVIVMSFGTYQFINILALVLVPLVPITWTLKKEKNHRHEYAAALKELVLDTTKGVLLALTAFVVALVTLGVASIVLYLINPMVTYGGIYQVGTYMMVAAFTGLIGSLVLCDKCSWYKHNLEKSPETILHGLNGIWWLFVLLATYLGSKEMASLYFAIYFLIFGTLASAAFVLLPEGNKYRLPIVFLLQWTVPFLFILQLVVLSVISFPHAIVDGTPEMAVYILLGLNLVLAILPMLFWIQVAGNQRSVLKVSSTLLLIMLVICFFSSPFNTGLSPKKMVYREEYNATASTSRVFLRSIRVEDVLTTTLNKNELETLECHVFADFPSLQECSYESPMVPLYPKSENEATISHKKTCDKDTCTLRGTYSSKNSLFCRLRLTENDDSITKAWINNGPPAVKDQDETTISALLAYTDKYNTEVPWGFTWSTSSPAPVIRFSCFYDEWTRGEIPSFVSIRDRLPADHLLLLRGQGLVVADFGQLDY
ncbi:hypothetical protein BC941DRAFT_433564 [Chlamydoabsidia padenii]|nr:hypothetical protein BC941DRAFT_433564 [Chlamydoabsidia padenii]